MTALDVHTGRPEVGPWLRGWIRDDEPQTTIIWRETLPLTRQDTLLSRADLEVFLAAAGPQLAEHLETETRRVIAWLTTRTQALMSAGMPSSEAPPAEPDTAAAPLDAEPVVRQPRKDEPIGVIISDDLKDARVVLAFELLDKEKRDQLESRLQGATLIVDVRIGGLERGLLHEASDVASDVTTLREPVLSIRVRRAYVRAQDESSEDADTRAGWRQEARIAVAHSEAGDEIEWLVAESRADASAQSEEGRAVGAKRAQKLDEHEAWAEQAARRIGERLDLPPAYTDLLALAARLHDEGKKAKCWQQAFRAPKDGIYGKTLSRPSFKILAGYRHELGSLPHAERDERVKALGDDMRDLCLHLIAAHHGNARPVIRTDGAEEPPSKLEARAQEIALRFTRLEKQWGPWGLAWWEALLRAADQQASRRNDEGGADG